MKHALAATAGSIMAVGYVIAMNFIMDEKPPNEVIADLIQDPIEGITLAGFGAACATLGALIVQA